MTDQQWRQAWDLYQTVSSMPPASRGTYIDSATADAEVRCEVRNMLSDSAENMPLQVDTRISGVLAATAAEVVRRKQTSTFPASHEEGSTFGRYRILKAIGRGGMGEIYEAADLELDRHVALKFLPAGSLDIPATLARLKQEARVLSAMNHPNIVTVHEVIQEGGQIAIVMELVEGQPLRNLCGPGPMPLQQFIPIALQIARALGAAHSRGIIHGDIKPENVMVRPDGYAKVLDFGLARRAEDPHPAGGDNATVIGTLRYMSPEQLASEQDSKRLLTPASDIYSLGLVLYEIASGQHPFVGTTAFSGLQNSAAKVPPPLRAQHPEYPLGLDSLILAMLQRDPADRMPTQDVIAKLEDLARTSDPRNLKEAAVNRRGLVATVFGAAAVLAGAIWWSANRHPVATAGAPVQIRPLTSQMGRESEPSLSPDGKWVAFLWTAGGTGRNPGLYVKSVQADTPLLLDTGESPHPIRAVTFSPDSNRVAFRRQDGIFEIPRDGKRPATKLAAAMDSCQGTGLDWSPDGQRLLLAECFEGSRIPLVMEVDLATGRRTRITNPPPSSQGDFDPHYSPDGRKVAFRRAAQPVVEDLYVQALGSAAPSALSRDGRGIAGLAWMPDGESLLVASQRSGGIYSLWRFYLDKPFEPIAFTQAGQHAKMPTVSRQGGRSAWAYQITDHNIWELPLEGGKIPRRIIASLQRDVDGNIGPDGSIAFRSDRSGVSEIWIAAPDGSSPVRVTSMDGPLTGTPRWSPDGKHLVFDSRPAGNIDIYLLRCEGAAGCQGPPRRLTDHPASDLMPSWSRDGKQIYFGSSRSGRREVWKTGLDPGAKPQQVTRNGGYLGMESDDGRWLYYSKISDQHGIWRMPLHGSGGSEELVADLFDDYGAGSFLLAPGGKEILYLGSGRNTGIRAWNILARSGRLLHDDPSHPIERGLSISRDGRRLIYSQLDRSDSNIMVAEGLR